MKQSDGAQKRQSLIFTEALAYIFKCAPAKSPLTPVDPTNSPTGSPTPQAPSSDERLVETGDSIAALFVMATPLILAGVMGVIYFAANIKHGKATS